MKSGSLRGDYCIRVGRNLIHGSDGGESAQHEIGMWFTEVRESAAKESCFSIYIQVVVLLYGSAWYFICMCCCSLSMFFKYNMGAAFTPSFEVHKIHMYMQVR